ncbi:MAG TPA: peptidyl-prolyl cis-trans isomerase [Solirubrobacteraceae bacterium]
MVSVALAACGSGVPGDSVADVAGNPITTRAFNHWMFVAAKSQAAQSPGAPVIVPNDPPDFNHCVAQVRQQIPTLAKDSNKTIRSECKQLFTSLSGQVLDFLIKGYWYQAEAAREHIKVTDADVQKAFDKAKKQQFPTAAGFNTFLSQTGQTLQDILFRFRINQIFQKLLAKQNSKVSAADIKTFYNSHLTQFSSPETRDIRIVLTKTKPEAVAAQSALHKGQSWDAVAKKYSIDPTTKNNGGLLAGVRKGQEDHALDSAAFSAPVNKLLGPVKGQFGYYVFEVTKISKPTQESLAQASPQIKQALTSQKSQASQSNVDKLVRSHWIKQTSCQSAYSMTDCNGYKAPSTSTTPVAPTTGAPPPTTTAPSTTPAPTTTTK